MLGMTFEVVTGNFFDSERIKRSVDAASRKVLSKFGAFVRQRAKTSIKPRKGASLPGEPPHSHTGLLRKFIFFAYEPEKKGVVIGPVLLRSDSQVPRLLEFGGVVVRTNKKGRTRQLRYRPRPYMRPAFEAEKSQLPELWRNSVR